jgi:hypothetical protein
MGFWLAVTIAVSIAPFAPSSAAVPVLPEPLPRAEALAEDWDQDLPERDEFRQSYTLQPGAQIKIADINGVADIETTTGTTAEVHVVRSARTKEDLDRRKIDVVHTPSSLEVRSAPDRGNWNWNREVRQRIRLRIPRDVSLSIVDISGRVRAGAVDGALDVADISGMVTIDGAGGHCTVTDVSGKVDVSVFRLGEGGLTVRDVSGMVAIGLAGDVGAELSVSDVSGRVNADLPNMNVHTKRDRNEYDATIGGGGPRIVVADVSGMVKLRSGR